MVLLPTVVLAASALAADAHAQIRYPRPYPGPYGYRYAGPESDLRLAVTPREAQVYVDGYLAGTVDEYDGVFQRLHVTPGEHEIVFYLQGYRTIRQRLYLSPNNTRKITETMEKLAAGESTEAPPEPPPQDRVPPPDPNRLPPRREPFPRGGQTPPRRPEPPEAPAPPAPSQDVRGGSILLRVQPADTEVTIDGEHWDGPSSTNDRLVIQVSEGRHRVEVRKDGYAPFSTEVDIQRGQSLPLNVSLARER
jgi:hypothetical protein